MATNFTNKYMQVFQNYNEFGEHSADYVRGEDHIAFLIEENEVIYWLYLEQVWRPLNVRTTTTGQLEDGRTKVAVRLEYVKGGQKYTSVPNIPDPERITSMSHFLEDYPDIEEVNVAGTVNLTDLSYAFAGSKIKDFSMLDTSNVTYFDYIFKDINDETRDLFLKINQSINNIIAGDIVLNNLTIESTNEKVISTVKLGESDIKNSLIIKGNINFELIYDTLTSNKFYRFNNIKSDANINLLSNGQDSYVDYNNIICKELTLGWNTINVLNNGYVFETHCDKIIIENGDNNSYTARDYRKIECYDVKEFILKTSYDNPFSGGIKFNNNDDVKITISDVINIGNFWFTTPIVDDAFYAKYAQYNIPISILQYKTTFEEVADINISSEVDSNLLYIDWNDILYKDFTSNLSIEVYNKLEVITCDGFSYNMSVYPKKVIIDNSNIDMGDDINNYPSVSIGYPGSNILDSIDNNIYRISGKFKFSNTIENSIMFKNVQLFDYNDDNDYCSIETFTANIYHFSLERNITVNKYPRIIFFDNDREYTNYDFDVTSFIKDNVLTIGAEYANAMNIKLAIKYIENTQLNILSGLLCIFRNWLQYTTENNPINILGNVYLVINTSLPNNTSFIFVDNVYINCSEDAYIYYLDGFISYQNDNITTIGKNIHGSINIILSKYNLDASYTNNNIEHIDINKVKVTQNSQILKYQSLNEESTIKLITNLIDNTDGTNYTIYMYRSQANIIGEENIAVAVAKNYEFAIIEN